MLQPQNGTMKYEQVFSDIDKGIIKIPKFQREFVWDKQQTAKLVDSIIKGFPLGTFIFWKTKDGLRHVKDIGNAKLPQLPKGDSAYYVLDGQQRLTSLYAVRKGLTITKDGREIDYKDIAIDLSLDPDDDDQVVSTEVPNGNRYITVYKLLNGGLVELVDDYSKDELKKIEIYQKRLTGYDFSTIIIADYPLDIACEVFTRINTGGTILTLFEIMVAKTYDESKKFDLAFECDMLIDNNGTGKDLEDSGYETVPHSVVLQCVAAHLCKQIRRKDILKLDKNKFIKEWPTVKEGIFKAVDYLRTHLRVHVSKLLPYPVILVPLTYFFIKAGKKPTSLLQNKLLSQYFWWASIGSRFTSGVEGRIAADLKRMDKILKEVKPKYTGEEVTITAEDLASRQFSASDAFCKAVVCLYAAHEPKSFDSGSVVLLDNSWLKQANSKNYHHFFPKAFLKKKGFDTSRANSLVNITLVSDSLNKAQIRAQAPSQYMKQFRKSNHDIDKIMKTHLIDDLQAFGIWTDDYEAFITKRAKKILAALEHRLTPRF